MTPPAPPTPPTPPADLRTKPTLTGDRVVLRPVTVDDTEALLAIMADPEVARLTGSVHSSDRLGQAPPLVSTREWYATRGLQDDRIDLVVCDATTAEVLGEAVLNDWNEPARSLNFRIFVGPLGRGRGVGTEATRLLVGYAFEVLHVHRVELEVYDFNPRARHVYEAVGFVHEGTRRDALRFDDAWIDAHDYSVLEHEWRAHRGHPRTRPAGG